MLIIEARTDPDFEAARRLFEEYGAWLGVDLSFQGFAEELENLRDVYAPPRGCLLLAMADTYTGCVAMKPFSRDACEMKRLYVRPGSRRHKAGSRLSAAIIDRARNAGYRLMLLDTLAHMAPARALYRSLGFRERGPYYDNPLNDVVYMELEL